jgi:hypothetical protein
MTPERKLEYAARIEAALHKGLTVNTFGSTCEDAARYLVLPLLEEALREMSEDVSADFADMRNRRRPRRGPSTPDPTR